MKNNYISPEEKQAWCCVSIVVHPNRKARDGNGNPRPNFQGRHRVKVFDYPRGIIERRFWYVEYWRSKIQVRFPRYKISVYRCYYDYDTKERLASKRRHQLSSAKAQITKVQNAIDDYVAEQKQTLFFDPESDPLLKKAYAKLEQKKQKLKEAQALQITETI